MKQEGFLIENEPKVSKKKRKLCDSESDRDFKVNKNLPKIPKYDTNPPSEVSKNEMMKFEQFECQFCYAIFRSIKELNGHTTSDHEAKKFNCDLCSSSFLEKGNLKTPGTSVDEDTVLNGMSNLRGTQDTAFYS